jgi:hypothetical protein
MLEPARITCPWCWQTVQITVDCSAGSAQYVEDCQVCCRPMIVQVQVGAGGELLGTEVAREGE